MKLRAMVIAGIGGAAACGSIIAFAAGPSPQGADAENMRYARGLLDLRGHPLPLAPPPGI